jgi:hypothetical protein
MNLLFHLHSGLRYLIVVMALVAFGVFLVGQLRGSTFGRLHRAMGAAYAGLVHLQVTLGIVLVAMGRYYPRLIGHMALMLTAAIVLQVLLSLNTRRAQPSFSRPLLGVVVSILCFVAGLAAIGRGLFEATAFAPLPG